MESLFTILFIGGIAGWLAGLIVKGYGFGLLGNIVVGIIGALVGTWLMANLGISLSGGIVGAIINAMIGAIVILVLIGLVRRG
jgi:uncharacterized membrane protein YeaQ/YmgE (transglycosylase-associated protein family)